MSVPGLGEDAAAEYRDALVTLSWLGQAPDTLAGLAVFRTGDPQAPMRALVADASQHRLNSEEPFFVEEFDDYCVYATRVDMPVYQQGEPPYLESGGGIQFIDGQPVFDHMETSRVVLTVPRGPAPQGGWPMAVMIRTGGGGDRPLVEDRGATGPGPPTTRGTRPHAMCPPAFTKRIRGRMRCCTTTVTRRRAAPCCPHTPLRLAPQALQAI